MPALTKEQISQSADRKVELVPCPEWGGDVYVRVMNGHERAAWEAETAKNKISIQNAALLLVYTLSDEHGNAMYQPTEIGLLKGKDATVLDRLFLHSARINVLLADDVDRLKKDCLATPSDSSS